LFGKQQLQLNVMSACHNPDTCALQPEPEHSNCSYTVAANFATAMASSLETT
jgi:hypothetical protein